MFAWITGTEMKKTDDETVRERALRFAADMLGLWHLCGNADCRRARACRGNVRRCAERAAEWFTAVTKTRKERLSFEAMEERLEGSRLSAFRRWKETVKASLE